MNLSNKDQGNPENNIGWLITNVDRMNFDLLRIDNELREMYPNQKDTHRFFQLENEKVKLEGERDRYKEILNQKIGCSVRYETKFSTLLNLERVRDGENADVTIILKSSESSYLPKTFRNRGS